MRTRVFPLLLGLLGFTLQAAAQTPKDAPATLRRLGLSTALMEVASGNEAAVRRLLGAPDSVGRFETGSGGLTDGLLYRGLGEYDVYVLFCTRENKDSWGCTAPMRSRPVYEVTTIRSFPDEASARRFERDANARLGAIATRRWVQCDMPNFDLEGGTTVSFTPTTGRISVITLFRTPPVRKQDNFAAARAVLAPPGSAARRSTPHARGTHPGRTACASREDRPFTMPS